MSFLRELSKDFGLYLPLLPIWDLVSAQVSRVFLLVSFHYHRVVGVLSFLTDPFAVVFAGLKGWRWTWKYKERRITRHKGKLHETVSLGHPLDSLYQWDVYGHHREYPLPYYLLVFPSVHIAWINDKPWSMAPFRWNLEKRRQMAVGSTRESPGSRLRASSPHWILDWLRERYVP